MAVSPDGKRLLSGDNNGGIRLWDLETQSCQFVGPQVSAHALAFSPDGRRFLVGYYSKQLQQYETATAKPVGPPLVHFRAILTAAYSPDGKHIATGCEDEDEDVRLWDAQSGKLLHLMMGHSRKVASLAFSRDGRLLASASWDFTVRLWDVSTGKQIGEPLRHLDLVQAVAFSPNNRFVHSGGDDSILRIWDVATGALRGHGRLPDKIQTVALSPDGQLLATGSKSYQARVWDVASGRPAGPPLIHRHEVHSLACTPDGQELFTGSWDHTVRRWQMPCAERRSLEDIRLWLEVQNGQRLDHGEDVTTLELEDWETQVLRLQGR
jgi:WD40 repeat protein